jgi:hypothetical protein
MRPTNECSICKKEILPGEGETHTLLLTGKTFHYHKECYATLRKKIFGRDRRKKVADE